MSRLDAVCAKAAAPRQASAAARQGRRFMRGRSAIAALDKLPILRCTLSTLSNRFNRAFFHAEREILTRRRKLMTETAHAIRIRKMDHVGLNCRALEKIVYCNTRGLGSA